MHGHGWIREEDVALVRERAAIADVVAEQVTLRNAGGGSLKGLCPFHEEKSPSFHVTPARGMFHCFGCGEGGDVISFVMKADHLPFAEAVERLAARAGVSLRYEEGGAAPGRQQGQRTRLVDAHRAAAEFYAEQLAQAEAAPARRFLAERGFDAAAAARFGLGYAPRGWDALVRHLRGRGFTDRELVAGGLAREGPRGLADRFVGRLLWPVRELSGEVVGFGARRLYDDDRVEAKYLNTPETPLYKKSQLLYGLDLARREVARTHQVVVVEGYTDVMACHLAGVGTAVATCGTAFGAEHIRVLRRLLADQHDFRGEVVFTFDGDAAGQRAAQRAFELDGQWQSRTFAAAIPDGMDPCELRQQQGDEAVRALVAARRPLVEVALRAALDGHDLATPEGRVNAVAAAGPLLGRLRDRALRAEYTALLARWTGLPPHAVAAAAHTGGSRRGEPPSPPGEAAVADPVLAGEAETLKLLLQQPAGSVGWLSQVDDEDYQLPAHRALLAAIRAAAAAAAAPAAGWVAAVTAAAGDPQAARLVTAYSVAPPAREQPGHAAAMLDEEFVERAFRRVITAGCRRRLAAARGGLGDPQMPEATLAARLAEVAALTARLRAATRPPAAAVQ